MSSQKSNKQTSKQVRVEGEKRTSCWKSHSPGIIFCWNMAYLHCTEAFLFCNTLFQVCINIVGSFKQGSICYPVLAQENLLLADADNFLSHHLVTIPIVRSKLLLQLWKVSELFPGYLWPVLMAASCPNCGWRSNGESYGNSLASTAIPSFQKNLPLIKMWGHNWKEHYKKIQPDPFCKRQNNDCGRELGNMMLWGPVQIHREVDVKGRQRQ